MTVSTSRKGATGYRWAPHPHRAFLEALDEMTEGILPAEPEVVVTEPEPVEHEHVEPPVFEPVEMPHEELSQAEQKAVRDFDIEKKYGYTRAANGRFQSRNFVFHPAYGDGVVIRQRGKRHLLVRFGHDDMEREVEEKFCAPSSAEWKRPRCAVCDKLFWVPVRTGRDLQVCSKKCYNERSAQKNRDARLRKAEEAAAEQVIVIEVEQEPVAALVETVEITPEPVPEPVTSTPGTGTRVLVTHIEDDSTPVTVAFLTNEEAADYLMGLL